MDFKDFIIKNHPDPDFIFGISDCDFEQLVVLAENFAKDYSDTIAEKNKTKTSKNFFSDEDLVSFGTYLLSKQRQDLMVQSHKVSIDSGVAKPLSVEETASMVHHSDLRNWYFGDN